MTFCILFLFPLYAFSNDALNIIHSGLTSYKDELKKRVNVVLTEGEKIYNENDHLFGKIKYYKNNIKYLSSKIEKYQNIKYIRPPVLFNMVSNDLNEGYNFIYWASQDIPVIGDSIMKFQNKKDQFRFYLYSAKSFANSYIKKNNLKINRFR